MSKDSSSRELSFIRELPMNGYGIADLLLLRKYLRNQNGKEPKPYRTNLISFEMKITDWRKALSQAFRYKYFANQSIVVLPNQSSLIAKKFLTTFKKLEVGLWSIDDNLDLIRKIYTPKLRKPINKKAFKKALSHFVEDHS